MEKFYRVNDRIRAPRVLLVDEDGQKIGEKGLFEALKSARDKNLDLVEIAPNMQPPVCRIMDYGKFKYDLAKQEKEQGKNRKESSLKEVRLSPNIDQHDLEFKAKQAVGFLEKGNVVRVTMKLRGRENIFVDRAMSVFETFAELSKCAYENQPKKLGNRIEANLIRIKGSDGETKDPQRNSQEN